MNLNKTGNIEEFYIEDCFIIQDACKCFGLEISIETAFSSWASYSGDYFAGWLSLPIKNEIIFGVVVEKIKELRIP